MLAPIKWHANQYAGPNRSTIHLREFVTRVLAQEESPSEVLDAGCGGGAKMAHLADLFPAAHWTGVDLEEKAIELARERLDPERFTLVQGDVEKLEETFGAQHFDISFSLMALSCVEDYERPIQQLLAVTRGWLFVLTLFAEGEIDAFIRIRGRMLGPQEGVVAHYNVYSLPRFKEFCRQHGAKEIIAEPFEMDIDIPRPDHGGMGTWTERLADGRRLQLSGSLTMPWWFVAVRV
jgi:ubiquinone/menaquinone biosynthesis C-methylase UbiE